MQLFPREYNPSFAVHLPPRFSLVGLLASIRCYRTLRCAGTVACKDPLTSASAERNPGMDTTGGRGRRPRVQRKSPCKSCRRDGQPPSYINSSNPAPQSKTLSSTSQPSSAATGSSSHHALLNRCRWSACSGSPAWIGPFPLPALDAQRRQDRRVRICARA